MTDALVRKLTDALSAIPRDSLELYGIPHVARVAAKVVREHVKQLEDLQAAAAEYVLVTEPRIEELEGEVSRLRDRETCTGCGMKLKDHPPGPPCSPRPSGYLERWLKSRDANERLEREQLGLVEQVARLRAALTEAEKILAQSYGLKRRIDEAVDVIRAALAESP